MEKMKRELSFLNCSNLFRTIKAAHPIMQEKTIQQQLNFARFLHSFLWTELECDRQECQTLARFVFDRGLATLVSDVGEEVYISYTTEFK